MGNAVHQQSVRGQPLTWVEPILTHTKRRWDVFSIDPAEDEVFWNVRVSCLKPRVRKGKGKKETLHSIRKRMELLDSGAVSMHRGADAASATKTSCAVCDYTERYTLQCLDEQSVQPGPNHHRLPKCSQVSLRQRQHLYPSGLRATCQLGVYLWGEHSRCDTLCNPQRANSEWHLWFVVKSFIHSVCGQVSGTWKARR